MITKEILDLIDLKKTEDRSKWGCGVLIVDPETGKILLAKRKDTKNYAFPGGKIEAFESPKEGAVRETLEESNIRVNSMIYYGANVHPGTNGKEWLTFHFLTNDYDASDLKNQSSELGQFSWYTVAEALELDLFPPARTGLEEAVKNGLLSLEGNYVESIYSYNDGNGAFPKFTGVEEVVNPYYQDSEGASYSYNPDVIDWL